MSLIIVIASIIGAGIGFDGKFLLDEVVISFTIFCFLGYSLTKLKAISVQHLASSVLLPVTLRIMPLVLLVIYLIAQSVRMFFYQADVRHLPYVAHLAYLLASVVFLSFSTSRLDNEKKLALLGHTISLVIMFNVLYVLHGVFLEILHWGEIRELPARFASQGNFWSGSAYAAFPSLAGLLSAALHPRISSFKLLIFFASVLSVAIFFDSRIAVAISIVIGLYLIAVVRLTVIAKIFIIIGAIYTVFVFAANFQSLRKTLIDSAAGVTFVFNPRVGPTSKEGDYDRQAHFLAGFRAISGDSLHFLVGHGYMAHRQIVGPVVREILLEHPVHGQFVHDNDEIERSEKDRGALGGSRTTTFTAILIDGGSIGAFAFISAIVYSLCLGMRKARCLPNYRIRQAVIGCAYIAMAVWPMIISLTEMTAYWFTLCLPALCALDTASGDRSLGP